MTTVSPVLNLPPRLGRYRLEGVLGEGPSGVVYKGYDPRGDRAVAIKVLAREVAASARGARLIDQARAVARLSHPGLVSIHEVERNDLHAYIVMEHVGGLNLAQWLAATPLPQAGVVLQVMEQLLEALAFVHHAGLRHGAVKPGNVIITGSGVVKLADVALSPLQPGEDMAAPELALGRLHDHGVDIYAAGVLLYRMLAGCDPVQRAIEGPSGSGVAALRPPSSFAQARRSPAFDPIVARALARDPGDRYPSAEAFRDALRATREQPRPVHGAESVELAGRGAALAPAMPFVTLRDVESGAPRALGAAARPLHRGQSAAPVAPAAPATPAPAPISAKAPPAAGGVPTLTIAIPDDVLSMPAYDPWGDLPQAGAMTPPAERPSPAATPAADPALRTLLGHARDGHRAQVQSAAKAASAVLAAVAVPRGAAEPAPLIEAEPFDPPSESVFQLDSALVVPSVPVSPAIPAEALRRVLKVLTPHFGGAAGMVLKQVAGQAQTLDELHGLLVARAGETVDGRKLRKQLKAVARLPL